MLLKIAAKRAGLKPRAWLVCDAIESLSASGFHAPTLAMLAETSGVSRSTVARALADLESSGIIAPGTTTRARAAVDAMYGDILCKIREKQSHSDTNGA